MRNHTKGRALGRGVNPLAPWTCRPRHRSLAPPAPRSGEAPDPPKHLPQSRAPIHWPPGRTAQTGGRAASIGRPSRPVLPRPIARPPRRRRTGAGPDPSGPAASFSPSLPLRPPGRRAASRSSCTRRASSTSGVVADKDAVRLIFPCASRPHMVDCKLRLR